MEALRTHFAGQPDWVPMKIGYVLDRFPSLHQTFVLREMLALEELGISIIIFSLQPAPSVFHRETEQLQAPVVYVPSSLQIDRHIRAHGSILARRPMRYCRTLRDALRTRRHIVFSSWLRAVILMPEVQAYDINHLHAHFAVGTNVVAMYLAELTGLSFSFTTHAVDLFARPVLLCESLRAAQFAVTISEYNRNFIAAACGAELAEKVAVIRAGIDSTEFASPERTTTSKPRILSVGRLIEKKGHRYLIEALAQLRDQGYDFECTIIGEGPEHSRLDRLIAEHCLDDRVELWGAATQEVVRQFYAESDIFALPCVIASDGDRDGIPVSLMEAMAAGLPVVSTTVSGIPELVVDGAGVLVPPRGVEALAKAVARLVDDPSLRTALGRCARSTVKQGFDIWTNARQLAGFFKQTCES